MNEASFSRAELLPTEELLRELGRRAELSTALLERLAEAVNSRVFDIFLYLWKYGPATYRQMSEKFPESTLSRALYQLEALEVVMRRDYRYRVRR